MNNNTTKTIEIKSIKQVVLALRGDKHIQETVFNLRLRFGILDRYFTKNDFYLICKDEDIILIDDFDFHTFRGVYMWTKTWRAIGIQPQLKNKDYLQVAFHELGHHFLHRKRLAQFSFQNQQTLGNYVIEAQANYFAELTMGVKHNDLFS
ncbi:MAG: ImmA/IrrE family metallo-endopeptidase [Pyrinomonadaceae bacterium]|jgi:Zn-dependent peptidase ImmA (M78 family)|nr:ImmA/IrrE family metallo-endopeptidase [Pyrinomonadaceae bacterium]